ncbi:MAG: HPr family phosphocarrier protein [Acetatifactor sp.]|nr:HPr family phosphocarrier protein [Acetatifactor sp.]
MVCELIKTIRLNPEEVQDFVNAASKCDFDIDVSYNRYIVDAKSFLGVFGLDLRQPLRVSYNGFNSMFEEFLKRKTIAC